MKTPLKFLFLLATAVTTACLLNSFLPSSRLGRNPAGPGKPDLTLGFHHFAPSFFKNKLPNGQYADVLGCLNGPYRIKLSSVVVDSSSSSGASLAAEPAVVKNGGQVNVTWKSVPDPSKRKPFDWIGFYCPSTAHPNAYIDYWLVRESSTYRQGYGSAQFTLYNMRMDCEFRYYTNDSYTELIAVSNKVTFVDGNAAPLQGHLALTGDPTQMRVHWTTGTFSVPTVLYGTSPDNLAATAMGISRSYKNTNMCGPPANESIFFIDPGYLHEVLLTGLIPNTRYYYRYGSENVFSDTKSFVSALDKGNSQQFTFIVYGDMDITLAAQKVASSVHKEVENGASFVFHAGDLSYATGVAYNWEMWMALIEPYSSLAPYMVCIGNHEYDYMIGGEKDPSHAGGVGFHPSWGNYGHDSGGECGVPVFYRFHMPDNGNSLWWYSYNYGLAHFTVFSTEHNFTAGSLQYQWLENDLQSVDRTATPWLILIGHRFLYSSEKYPADNKVGAHIRESLEELIHQYQVDITFWGHYHAYERTCAVYKEQCNAKGTVHILVGSAGIALDSAGTYKVPWSMHFELSHGYGRVTVANRSGLLWEYIRVNDHAVADSIWLTK